MARPATLVANLLILVVVVRQAEGEHRREWLDFACNKDGVISAVNPDPEHFKFAFASSISGPCKVEFSDNNTLITISECETREDVTTLAFSATNIGAILVGGKELTYFFASCMIRKTYFKTVNFTMVTEGAWRASNESLPEPKDLTVDFELLDLKGHSDFTVYSIGYPITIKMKGPPGTSILPRRCKALPGTMVTKDTMSIEYTNLASLGCTSNPGLMFDFTEDKFTFFEHEIPGFDPTLIVMSGMAANEIGESEPEVDRPTLMTHMFAFRFFSSPLVNVACHVFVCPEGDPLCNFNCEAKRDARRKNRLQSAARKEAGIPDPPEKNLAKYIRQMQRQQSPIDSRVFKKRQKWVRNQLKGKVDKPSTDTEPEGTDTEKEQEEEKTVDTGLTGLIEL